MSILTVKFIDKEYTIPKDVLTYIDLLKFTDSVQKTLTSAFVRKLRNEIAKDNIGLLGDEDLATEIEQQVSKFIAKLCDNGIFTRTIGDYLKNNKGYQLYSDVNKSALEKMKSILIQEMDAWQAGYENAVNKAESNITGMGFSIWSGSFVNHAIYAAMEASTINKQEKEAQAQYQKDMNDLRSRLDSQYGGEKSNYINNTYIPNMEAALTVFAYELLDKYVNDLIANDKFDRKTLEFVDISRSNDLLKNLTLSENKKAILENAFLACPYNIAVYMQAMKYELLDFDSFQTAKIFKQSDEIISFLKSSWGEVSYPTKFDINYHCINMLSLFTEKSATELLHSRTEQYVVGIVKAYSRVADMLANKDLCYKVIREFDDTSILAGNAISKGKAHSYVDSIVTPNIWNQLVDKCGQVDLLERIKTLVPSDLQVYTKRDVDEYFIEQLLSNFEEARENIIVKINAKKEAEEKRRIEQERQKAEQERIRQEKQAKRKVALKKGAKISAFIIAGIMTLVILGSLILLFVNNVIIPANRYNDALALMDSGDWFKARDLLLSLDDYKDSEDLLEQCNNKIRDYKYDNALQLIDDGKYSEAVQILEEISDYKDSDDLLKQCREALLEEDYNNAVLLMKAGEYEKAIAAFTGLAEYKDSANLLDECQDKYKQALYDSAIDMIAKKEFEKAYEILSNLGDYKDVRMILNNHFKVVPLKEIKTNKDGEKTIIERTIEPYGTNSQGTLIKETQTYEDGDIFVMEEIYDAYGNLIVYLNIFSSGKETGTTYTYDSNHKLLIQRNAVDYHGEVATTNYEYDSNNRLTKTILVEEDGTEETTTFTYDVNGNLIKEYSRLINEKHSKDFPYETTIEYTYDANGNVLTQTWTFDDGDQSVTRYYYDENGFLIKEVAERYDDTLEYNYDNNYYLIEKTEYSDGEKGTHWEYSDHAIFYSANGFSE